MRESIYFDPEAMNLLLTKKSENEVIDFVHRELRKKHGDKVPEKAVIKSYLTSSTVEANILVRGYQEDIMIALLAFHHASNLKLLRLIADNLMQQNGFADETEE